MWLILILGMAFAGTFTLAKDLVQYFDPIFLVGLRMMIGGSLLLTWSYVSGTLKLHKKSDLWLFAKASFFHIFLTYVLEFCALPHVSSSKTAMFFNLSSFFTAAIMVFGYGAHLSGRKWLAIAIGFIGFIPLLIAQAPSEEFLGELFSISVAEIFLLCAVFSASLGWILIKDLLKRGYSSWQANGFCMLSSGLLAILTWIVSFNLGYSGQAVSLSVETTLVSSMVFRLTSLVFLSNVFCYNLYGFLLKEYSATFISLSMMLVPLFSAFFGWYFLGEIISIYFMVTLLITSAALYLFYQEDLSSNNIS